MTERDGVRRYLYWSDRQVRQLLEDNDVDTGYVRVTEQLSTPTLGGLAPILSTTSERIVQPRRPGFARLVERVLDKRIPSNLGAPAPFYLKGEGSVVFGEFIHTFSEDPTQRYGVGDRAFMYTSFTTPEYGKVGVCLFGSMENYADFIPESGYPRTRGWYSSAAPDIERFLQNQHKSDDDVDTGELAVFALQTVLEQGQPVERHDSYTRRAWNRTFTFGDALDVTEWLARIDINVDVLDRFGELERGHRRVLVGAPLWCRTPSLRTVRLYADYSPEELDAIEDMRHVKRRAWWHFWRR